MATLRQQFATNVLTVTKFRELMRRMRANRPNDDLELIRKAYEFSQKHHAGQSRASGEPYLAHPLEVALVLAEMKMDPVAIAAGLLHDSVEDTSVTVVDIRKEFGEQVAHIVEGVTKISAIDFATREEQQAENLRKMMLAMVDDIRVVLIKLADRLHNMRTLEHLPPERQQKIARETLDIYASIAHRLGMGKIRGELEDLGFRYVDPIAYQQVHDAVEALRHFEGGVETVSTIYLVDSQGTLAGAVPLAKLVLAAPDTPMLALTQEPLISTHGGAREKEVAELFDKYNLRSLPVVDNEKKLVGVIHADLFPDNVLFLGEKLSGLIDFYFACNDILAYDVAICLNAWCFEPDHSFNVTKARAFLGAYGRERKMSDAEQDALPLLARGAALRILLTRLVDWFDVPPGALVKPKDPLEYFRKLRFQQSVASVRDYGIAASGLVA